MDTGSLYLSFVSVGVGKMEGVIYHEENGYVW